MSSVGHQSQSDELCHAGTVLFLFIHTLYYHTGTVLYYHVLALVNTIEVSDYSCRNPRFMRQARVDTNPVRVLR